MLQEAAVCSMPTCPRHSYGNACMPNCTRAMDEGSQAYPCQALQGLKPFPLPPQIPKHWDRAPTLLTHKQMPGQLLLHFHRKSHEAGDKRTVRSRAGGDSTHCTRLLGLQTLQLSWKQVFRLQLGLLHRHRAQRKGLKVSHYTFCIMASEQGMK